MKAPSQVDLILYNCKVYTKTGFLEAGIAIENGKIVKIAKYPNLPKATRKIDLKRLIALPGLIDVHVHLRDQELAYKETFYTGTAAAAAGGITFVMDMPNNQPVTMSAEALKERAKLAEKQVLVNTAFYSAFPEKLEDMVNIVKAGAIAFKLFLNQKIGGINIEDDQETLKAFEMAKNLKTLVAVHAEDRKIIEERIQNLKNQQNLEAYLKAHDVEAEVKAVKKVLALSEKSKASIHFCHLSSKESLEIISKAKKANMDVTCEVTPHHLLLTSQNFKTEGSLLLTDPPVREKDHSIALLEALKNGIIDILASDHAPHKLEEKMVGNVWEVKPGIPGLETMLPLVLTYVNKGIFSFHDVVRFLAENPARRFGLDDRGVLEEGKIADITVIDINKEDVVDSSRFYSKARFSPFEGWKVKGKPVKTFVYGNLVMDDGEVVAKAGTGQVFLRKY